MSMINKEVSDFSVQAYQNGEFKTVTKADILGKWSVFFFYPADFTFVCPTELEDLQNKYSDFQAAGCEIYSVSTDSHFVHKAWHDSSERIGKITYPMLADPTHALCKDFEVLIESDGMAERGSFIVNPEGKIVVYEEKYGLAFTLLADPERKVIEAYDVWKEKKNYGKVSMGVVRTTYLIDENEIIIKANDKVKAADDPENMLKELT